MIDPNSARMLTYVMALVGLLATTTPLRAQRDSIDQWIESYMREQKAPGLALAILRRGQIVKAKGYGLAHVELNVPVTPNTVFQSASLAKPFTAAAILLLAEQGKLALDDRISKYLDSTPESWQAITIRHLLAHTSGIPDYEEGSADLDYRRDYTEPQLLQVFAGLPLLFEPGDDWAYSNSGYVLLGMIIRRATGAHWSEFVRQRIFRPLGMETANVISEQDIVPNRAAGYRVVEGELKNQEWVAPSWNTTADGSLYLTLLDLAKWDAALIGRTLLSDSTKQLSWASTRMNDGTSVNHGFGWFLGDEPQSLVETSGAWQGFRNHIARYLKDSITVIVLSNSTSVEPTRVAHNVAALYDPRLAPVQRQVIPLSPSALEEYAGAYRLATGDTIQIRRSDDGLGLQGIGPAEIRFRPHAKDAFFLAGTEARLVFVRDEKTQRIRWVRLLRNPSMPTRAKKIE